MRVGFNTVYTNLSVNQQNSQEQLLDISKKLSSGRKIQFGHEDSSTFIDTLRLDYEVTTTAQNIRIAEQSQKFSDNTDASFSQMTIALDNFKTKLLYAANEIHSDESLQALADDMESIRDYMVSIANTSVGGDFIFSGSKTETTPIAADFTYQGNGEELQSLVGSNNLLTYNINGEELFLGKDSDKNKIITSNIKQYNQELLHPDIMSEINKDDVPEEVFIESTDTLRALLGDDDDITGTYGKDNSEYFYMRGRKPDGTAFESKFNLTVAYDNEDASTKVQDLMDRVGVELGNTTLNEVVDVSLNKWGQLVVRDLQSGRELMDFHLVSSTDNVDDIDDLVNNGTSDTQIKTYFQSGFYSLKTVSSITATNDQFDHRIHTIDSTLKRDDNSISRKSDPLTDIFGPDADSLVLTGTDVQGNAVNTTVNFAGNTIQSLMDTIETTYGVNASDLTVELSNGKISIIDNTVAFSESGTGRITYDGTSLMSLSMETQQAGVAVNGINNDFSVEYDRVRFEKDGATLSSNISQFTVADSEYATLQTSLRAVAGPLDDTAITLDGETYTMEIKDITGQRLSISLDLADAGTTFTVTDLDGTLAGGPDFGPFNLFDPFDSSVATPADEVTFQQLADVISIGMNFSNLVSAGVQPTAGNTAADVDSYRVALENSQNNVDVDLDYRGRLFIQDVTSAQTQAEFSIYNESNQDFGAGTGSSDKAMLTFNASTALVVDRPHVDFFDTINEAIDAVRFNIYRPDGYNQEGDFDAFTQNIGIQNVMETVDHLADHLNKLNAKNGSQGEAFQFAIEKNEIIKVQVQTLKSAVLDADIAETSLQFSQMSLNYQAMLSSVSRINSLSLVNFL